MVWFRFGIEGLNSKEWTEVREIFLISGFNSNLTLLFGLLFLLTIFISKYDINMIVFFSILMSFTPGVGIRYPVQARKDKME